MDKDKFIFSQLVPFLDRNKFNHIVRKSNRDKYVKHFTCWNLLLALMFGQLSSHESLRGFIVAFEAHHSKCYHLGMGKNVSKSSLARLIKTETITSRLKKIWGTTENAVRIQIHALYVLIA